MVAGRIRSLVIGVAVPIAFSAGHAGAAPQGAAARTAATTIPERIADSTFWRMITEFSEPNGYFSSDNFVSNEGELQYVIGDLTPYNKPGGVYLGVGPEQNFTYIAAFKPRIAFICDIRRQNLIEHLMYKALFELSSDRADFLSRLWSRERPEGLNVFSSPDTLAARFGRVPADSVRYRENIDAILSNLVDRHRFALTSEDSASLRYVYSAFYLFGPNVSYSSRPSPFGPVLNGLMGRAGLGFTRNAILDSNARYVVRTDSLTGRVTVFSGTITRVDTSRTGGSVTVTIPATYVNAGGLSPTFASLMIEDDGAGVQRGWLATEENFRTLKDFEARNLLVPIVGDFGGPTALRSIGQYLRAHEAKVNLFYLSNVEQYLFQSDAWTRFYANVGALPRDSTSSFIRSASNSRFIIPRNPRTRMAQMTSPIDTIVRLHQSGALSSYVQVLDLRRR